MTTPIPGIPEEHSTPFHHSAGSPPARQPIEADDELFIRETFRVNPKEGCSLLFRRYYLTLCNHASRFVHSREAAEDIVSEFFELFWEQRIFEQPIQSYRAYLYTAVRHRAYNYLRWQIQPTDSIETVNTYPVSSAVTPDEAMQYTELSLKIESIIQSLPPQCRRAYLLKKVEGRKYIEIAEELQISQKAVEGLVSRALARLRSGLSESWFLIALFVISL